ncbi:PaaI family thioesterase [Candidatus Woesearchaeota archaeon]|nr:PaaI family thioesterase [Candidatus Woesearchaeota archaeon]
MKLYNDNYCFVCGKKNKIGLKLEFETKGRKTKTVFTPKKEHQGYKDVVHGGILATVLDEAMTRLGYELGLNTVTARIEVDLKKPAYINEKLFLEGEIIEEKERKVLAKSVAKNADGEIVAEAKGVLVKLE